MVCVTTRRCRRPSRPRRTWSRAPALSRPSARHASRGAEVGLVAYEGAAPGIVVVRLNRPDKLFIAAVHGWAAGQGLELCIASDLIVAAEDARLYFAEVRVGFNMTSGVAKILPLLVGLGNAKRLALLGAKIDAAEAYRMGLVVEVVPAGRHEVRALELAAEAVECAPLAVAAQKRLLDSAIELSLAATQDFEVMSSLRLTSTEDHQEAKRAFAEKRAPHFRGT